MVQKILVIGGAGYIGGSLVSHLLAQNYNVTVYDNLLFEQEYRKEGINFIYGDIRDKNKLKEALKGQDAVVFLAAMVGDGAAAVNPEASLEINRECVEWLASHYDGRIIFLSSCSVYGEGTGVLNEDSPTKPLSLYAISKLQAERLLKDKNALIYRLGTLFGVGDEFSRIRLDLVLNTFVFKAVYEKKLSVFGGEQYRPLLHVKDVAEQITKSLFSDVRGVFNLGYQNTRIVDLAYQVRSHFNDTQIEIKDIPTEDLRNYRVDSSRARKMLDFRPVYTLDDGINELKRLFTEKRIKNPFDIRYHNHNYLKTNPHYLDFDLTEDKKNLKIELEKINISSVI